jgi:4-amino-4-deoxychorismate lyase
MNARWVFLNGDFSLEQEAKIPVTDRGFLFGEGMFTTVRVHKGNCELFKEHLKRLQRQAEDLNFYLPTLHFEWIQELILRNQALEGTWRLKIIMSIKQELGVRTIGNLLATLHPYQERTAESCSLCIFPFPYERPLAHVKSLSYLDQLYIRNYAFQQGYEDAITRNADGILLETSCSNLFWIEQEKCWIPDQQLPYLKGVFLQALCRHLSLPIHFVRATIDLLPSNANIYTCNALTHIRPVISIDHRSFQRNEQWEYLLQKATDEALKEDSFYTERI